MKMEWNRLLSNERFGDDSPNNKKRSKIDARNEFERDIDRIIFSSEFRRLQDKTQVFPIPKSDFVHTRLTHSLEVAAVGRSLGKLAGIFILDYEKNIADKTTGYKFRTGHFGNIVAAACLAHDIGNPPIGHSGEDAFRRYFKNQERKLKESFSLTKEQIADFSTFEGNAAGFRILTNDHPSGKKGGLRLTYATLGAFSKYPKQSGSIKLNSLGNEVQSRASIKEGKFGFFQREKDIFRNVAEHLGLKKISDTNLAWCRHPLSFLVEAADTICYSFIDIEDGYHLGYVKYDQLKERLMPMAKNILPDDPCNFERELANIKNEKEQVGYLRSRAINNLTNLCIGAFKDNYEAIMNGTFDSELTDSISMVKSDFDSLCGFNKNELYDTPKGVQIEIAGYRILEGLLDYFLTALENIKFKREHELRRSKKIMALLPNYLQPTLSSSNSYLDILKICDFVSRSTDSYAIDIYKKFNGDKFPIIE